MITLPKDWKEYSNSIRDRCKDLIDMKIWGGIDINQFNAWRQNFKTDEEKYFKACVLDSLIYRSNEQTFSLINQMLNKNLNNLFRTLKLNEFANFPASMQNSSVDPLIRIVPVIKKDDPVTKSSNEILRFMKRYFLISENWIINPWNINDHLGKGAKAIIFIDDFLGSGNQFDEACIWEKLDDTIKANTVIYAPLVAHEAGINYLMGQYKNLKITYAEKLDKKTHSFFSNYFPGNEANAKAFYLDMLKKRGINPAAGNEYGYGNLELTFASEHAAPDNSLQILHLRDAQWAPLFNR